MKSETVDRKLETGRKMNLKEVKEAAQANPLKSIREHDKDFGVAVKRSKFDEKPSLPVLRFIPIDEPILKASYEVAYLIANQDTQHTIGETLVKPTALKMANIMQEKAAEDKLSQIPPSNDTISKRINYMSNNILAQVVGDLISSPVKFSLQLDETTSISNLRQLVVFVRYMKDNVIQENFLFCTTTKEVDVKKFVNDFFRGNNLSWNMVSAVCWDGAPAMLGRHSGFEELLKSDVLKIIITQCVLQRHSLATKTIRNAMKHRLFKELCKEMYLGIRGTSVELKQVIAMHLEDLTKSLEGYFPTTGSYPAWVIHLFTFSVATANVNDEYLDEIIEREQSQLQLQLFRK
ncbi:protein FAM200C-like [Lepeophtheirus salmonis]|uniref:protein FAM200C-like n=1 Tax=Lepeophtheirus salmonis TaxID=72036 RepID=UPI003AF33A95